MPPHLEHQPPLPDPAGPSAKVVLLLQDLLFGGTQRQCLELARSLDLARFEVELWMLAAGDDLAPLAGQWRVKTRWLARDQWVGPRALAGLWRALAQDAPDLLVLQTVLPNIWGRVLGRLPRRCRVIATCRGGGSIKRQHERLLWPLADHMICNTPQLHQRLRAIYGRRASRVSYIANGVDTERFTPPGPDDPLRKEAVLCLARLVPDKDHATLLRSFALVARERTGAELWLAGEGPLERQLKTMAADLGLGERVRFLGSVDDPRPLLRKASVLALTSRLEAMPNAVLEAMACGLPVVSVRVGALPEMVEAAGAGVLAPVGDHEALAQAMLRVLGNSELARSQGRAGRLAAEKDFSLAAMAQSHEQVFHRVLAGRRSTGEALNSLE